MRTLLVVSFVAPSDGGGADARAGQAEGACGKRMRDNQMRLGDFRGFLRRAPG